MTLVDPFETEIEVGSLVDLKTGPEKGRVGKILRISEPSNSDQTGRVEVLFAGDQVGTWVTPESIGAAFK